MSDKDSIARAVNAWKDAAAIALAILFYKEAGDEFFPKRFSLLTNQRPMVRIASYACLLAIIVLLGVFDNTQFLYFQY